MLEFRGPQNQHEWETMLDMRQAALRRRNDAADWQPGHYLFGYWSGQKLLGCLRIDLEDGKAILRHVAASTADHQEVMLLKAEEFVQACGYNLVALAARKNDWQVFQNYGYELGKPLQPSTAPHEPVIDMHKTLSFTLQPLAPG